MGKMTLDSKKENPMEEWNILADTLARDYSRSLDPSYPPRTMPIPRPNYKVRLLHNGLAVAAKLYKTLHTAWHSSTLQHHIMRKATWPFQVFNLIDRVSLDWSCKCLTQGQHISMAKIVHHLEKHKLTKQIVLWFLRFMPLLHFHRRNILPCPILSRRHIYCTLLCCARQSGCPAQGYRISWTNSSSITTWHSSLDGIFRSLTSPCLNGWLTTC
jgi:hypothetical protein